MKKLISLLLISFGLHGQQTLVKLKQVGDGQTTGSFVVTGAPNGALTTTPQSLFVTTAQATSSYVPYSGATTSVDLGANSFSAGAQSTISTLYVPNTATVNGALKANSTLTVAGTSSLGPVYIASPSTSTGLYIETDNTGSQFPLVINAHSGSNPVAILQGTNNSIMIWKNIPTNNSWRAHNNVAATGAGLDSWGVGESANPVSNYFSITHTTGYGEFRTGLNVGSLAAPTKTLSVLGDANITNSLTVSGTVVIGGTTAPTTTLGSALTVIDGLGVWRIGKYNSTGRSGIWGHTLTPTTSNYNFVVDGDNVNAYVHGGSILNFVTNNTLRGSIGLTTTYFNQPTRIGSSTAPSATLDVTGTMSVSSTATLASNNYFGTASGSNTTTIYGASNAGIVTFQPLIGATTFNAMYMGNATPASGGYFLASSNMSTNYVNAASRLNIHINDVLQMRVETNTITIGGGINFLFDTSVGSKLGLSTSQKLGFWNATPIVQPANTVAIDNVLINTGLRASGGAANFSLKITNNLPQNLKGYTVATLPAGVVGDIAYVTDALAPAYLVAVVGGGAVKTPVFFDGTNWVAH